MTTRKAELRAGSDWRQASTTHRKAVPYRANANCRHTDSFRAGRALTVRIRPIAAHNRFGLDADQTIGAEECSVPRPGSTLSLDKRLSRRLDAPAI